MRTPLMLLSLGYVALACLSSCNKDEDEKILNHSLIAAFNYQAGKLVAPVEVTFTNQSEYAESYSWNFGDGSGSIEKDPKHIYQQEGTFKVTLTAYSGGNQVEVSDYIEIKNPYTKCILTGYILDELPLKKLNGQSWDSITGPDLLFRIHVKGNPVPLFCNGPSPDFSLSTLPFIQNGIHFTFPDLKASYDVLVYDDDSPDNPEFMGGYYFSMRDATGSSKHYPDTMLLYQNGFQTKIRLILNWGY
ncbi:MAG: PKD domain-containing protein [Bacteroidia bacterium]|nr:PKD domain-containing protein [Bacteroidia bacterium]